MRREPSDPVAIGRILAPHGVRGTVRVKAFGAGRHLREGVVPLVGDRRREILRSRPTPKGFLVDFEGVGSRGEAEELRGERVLLDRTELDEPDEEEYYVADLIGLEVVSESGEIVGRVAETFETPAHEVIVVRGGGEEIYLPFTREHVPGVDLERGRLVARLPEGV